MSGAENPTSILRWLLTALAVVALAAISCPPAQAQSNSLLHARHRPLTDLRPVKGGSAGPVSTTQPALDGPSTRQGQAETPLSPAAGLRIRPARKPRDPADEPPPNQVLLTLSPIAVEAPQPKKIRVHDLVTVIIREARESLTDGKLKSEKDWQLKAQLAQWFRLDKHDRLVPQNFTVSGAPGVDFDFGSKYEGEGKYDRKDSLTTRIQARVIDVKPNGNLVLEASKEITVGDEVQVATLTGECRAEDVTAQNTVLSTQVADLKIHMPDRGAVRDATRRGWLMRAFDFLRPI